MGIRDTFSILASAKTEQVVPALITALKEKDDRVVEAAAEALTSHKSEVGYTALIHAYPRLSARAKEIIGGSLYKMQKFIIEMIQNGSDEERATLTQIASTGISVDTAEILLHLMIVTANEEEDIALENQLIAMVNRFMATRQRDLEAAEAQERKPTASIERDYKGLLSALGYGLETMYQHRSEVPLMCALKVGSDAYPLITTTYLNKNTNSETKELIEEQLTLDPTRESVDYLFAMLDHESDKMRKTAFWILSELDSDEGREAITRSILDIEDKQLKRLNRLNEGMPWLLPFTNHTHLLTVRHLELFSEELKALTISEEDKLPYYFVLCTCRIPQVARKCLEAIGKSKVEGVAKDLEELMREASEETQLNVIEAMKELKLPMLHEVLTPFLGSESEGVRDAARSAVAPGSFDRFYDSFPKLDWKTREKAGKAAVQMDPDGALGRLVNELRNPSPNQRLQAVQVIDITEYHAPLTEYLVKMVGDGDRRVRASVVDLLAKIKTLPALKALIQLLSDRDPRVQANAVEAIDQLNQPEFKKVLMPFLNNSNNRTRGNACRALWKLGVRDEVIAAMKEMLTDKHSKMRQSGAWAIAENRPEGALKMLEDALAQEKSERVQTTLKQAISKLQVAEGE